ncbi:alcohol dehydrogenase [acceptor]-like isoform X1 [Leptidea sinapis]|uniref:alcohol dehydrogenase [acceptor]-like isoform X1 n=2 Tax=Leptidea sinapis TaxID=189913 RepID=UPI0021C27E48|nr:alcohol dehydrogenase [acceptor]-like isoform X1 [Leptidea sinapis]
MSPFYWCQFLIISLCVHSFSFILYFIYSTDFLLKQQIPSKYYDFIIIGSGTAGSLIAHRLSTETNYTFVVLEAGGRSYSWYEIPILGPLLHGSIYDWGYETVHQKSACFAMEGNKCKQPQGKILGGSAKLNNMIHVRGNISHYVEWFHRKYPESFIKEQFEYIEKNILKLNNIRFTTELSNGMLEAARELGYNELDMDFKSGFRKPLLYQDDGKRWTISDLIYKHVLTNTFVEKLLIKENKCIGVKLLGGFKIFANNGVILSAGTLSSPKILQLSGIGPAKLLKRFNITLVKDLPVGKNLQDHIGTGLDLVQFNRSLSINSFNFFNPYNIFNYFFHGQGPFTTPGCEAIGFLSTKNTTVPDIQFMVLPVGISTDRGSHIRKSLNLRDKTWFNYFANFFENHTSSIFTTILSPKSRGEVYIQSSNAVVPPIIDPKYLSDREDVSTLIDGVKLLRNFVLTESMKSIGAFMNTNYFPGCEEFEYFSNSYLECYIRHLTLTSYHPIGTCSMGLPDENSSVVDLQFKVLGIDNLFVVDGSVLPTLPSGNINAAIAMMSNIFFIQKFKPNNGRPKSFCTYRCKYFISEFILKICQKNI